MSDATLLPPSSTALERAIDLAMAERLRALQAKIPEPWSIERCPEPLLGYLAWALSVDDWSDDWPEETKRAVIKASIPVHRRKGTPGSVEDAIGAVTGEADISEWWEYAGPRHTFRVEVPPFDAPGRLGEIIRAIRRTKPAHAHLDLLTWRRRISGRVTVGGIAAHYRQTRLRHDPIPKIPAGRGYVGTVLHLMRTTYLDMEFAIPAVPQGRAYVGAALHLARTLVLQPEAYATPARFHPDQVFRDAEPVSSGAYYIRSTK